VGEKRRILVVDDDEVILRAVSQALARKGYEVATADSGAAAVDWLSEHQPDLVILDIVMPDMSGYEVCRILRLSSGTAQTPVIFLTSKKGRDDMDEATQAGSDLFLTKPILPSRLINMVEMFLSPDAPLARR
jgi:CheY-like chemotaxis protein